MKDHFHSRHLIIILPLLAAIPLLFEIPSPEAPRTALHTPRDPGERGATVAFVASAAAQQHQPEGRFVAGELLVSLREECGDASSVLAPLPVTVKGRLSGLGVLRLGVPVGEELEVARRLRELPEVEWVEPNYLREVMRAPAGEPYQQSQWGLRRIQAEQAWSMATGSPEVIVAVLDTGIDRTHPDLAGTLVAGYDFLGDDSDPDDDSGHGTFNAGVIGAGGTSRVKGVARGVRIMPIKVLDAEGKGPNSAVAQGLVYAVDHGARVVNMSFGNPVTSRLEAQAIRYAHDKGAVLVAAAGNTANQDNAIIYPAAHEQVLAVAAIDEEDNVPDFSQHHPYVGVSAPGVGILSTYRREAGYGDYATASGTSAAAPHVSGLAALILSANPGLTNTQVKTILQATAEDLGVPGKDEYYGAGVINAFKALLAATTGATPAATATPAPPTTPSTDPIPSPAATTPTRSGTVWHFAEGSTASPFDLWLLLQNPNDAESTARITYMKADGSQQMQEVTLPPASRRSIHVNPLIPESELSIKVESDSPVFAERAMYFRSDGHGSAGVAAPSTNWYMAEGSTGGGFDTWILLQNPSGVQANARVTFLSTEGAPKEVEVALPPTSRRSIHVNQLLPNVEVSTVVTSDRPIVAERAMYFRQAGGHGSTAASQAARSWYLAEGRVGQGLDSWLLAMNPNSTAANLKVAFMGEKDTPRVGYYAMRPGSRLSIYMNGALPPGKWGARVESDRPIVVERSTYFAGGRGGHNVVGSATLSREWYLPEGSTQQPFTEEIAILNPDDRGARLAVTFMTRDGGSTTREFAVNPTSRLTLRVNDLVPDTEVSSRVVSDVPIAVERSMYFANGLGGTSAFGIPR